MRKSIQEIIDELKKENVKVDHIQLDSIPEGYHEEDHNYSKESLINNLFKDETSTFIHDFEELKSNEENELLYLHIDSYSSEATGIEKGNYIALDKGTLDLEDYANDTSFETSSGEPVPRGVIEDTHACTLLFKVNGSNEEITQGSLVREINNGISVKSAEVADDLILTSNAKVDYLEIVDQAFFDNRIDETLKRYNEVHEPDEDIQRSLKYKKLLEGNKKMVFCPIIDKEVYIFEGED